MFHGAPLLIRCSTGGKRLPIIGVSFWLSAFKWVS